MRRILTGAAAALACMAALTGAMLPLRGSVSIATMALVLVVPVVLGVVTGGFEAGIISVAAGFLAYDFFFIPPYLTLSVGAPQNWTALGVYAVVMLPVARVVAGLNTARARELRQGREIRQLFELSDLLVEDKPLDVLLTVLVNALSEVFGARQVAVFLPAAPAGAPGSPGGPGSPSASGSPGAAPGASSRRGSRDGRLGLAASAGEELSAAQLNAVLPAPGTIAGAGSRTADRGGLAVIALAASGRPVGLLALSADAAARHEREPLLLFANHIALAVERAQLRDQALRTRVNAEMARIARTLVAAVAHDLRAPLASLKASSSTLADPSLALGDGTRRQLAGTIDAKADQLADMVRNLLDMSRIQAGTLRPRRTVTSLRPFVSGVIDDPPPSWGGHEIVTDLPGGLPPVDIDLVLMTQVLTNLIDNAVRHSPEGAPVTVRAALRPDGTAAEISVTDSGPGVPAARREEIFGPFPRREHDAGAGLGLMIARTFTEAHGQRIWAEDAPGGGARFCFTLPTAARVAEESRLAPSTHH
ncbi:MAG TPA: ATP-binding protein [Trebonia sp.]|jgi:two-component system sensor histidine kinase KdpD|nr:ATP-binding protein [Trebonia sp.]